MEAEPIPLELSSSEDDLIYFPAQRAIDKSESDDDVVIIEEINPRKKRVANSKLGDDGDDDCCIVAAPEAARVSEGAFSDVDELAVIAESGPVACRDFPHARYLCVRFPFKSSSPLQHCEQCHCYVCDIIAPCDMWAIHCCASDKDERWITLRKTRNQQPNISLLASVAEVAMQMSSPFSASPCPAQSSNKRSRLSGRRASAPASSTPAATRGPTMADYALGAVVRGGIQASPANARATIRANPRPNVRPSPRPGFRPPATIAPVSSQVAPTSAPSVRPAMQTSNYRPAGYLKVVHRVTGPYSAPHGVSGAQMASRPTIQAGATTSAGAPVQPRSLVPAQSFVPASNLIRGPVRAQTYSNAVQNHSTAQAQVSGPVSQRKPHRRVDQSRRVSAPVTRPAPLAHSGAFLAHHRAPAFGQPYNSSLAHQQPPAPVLFPAPAQFQAFAQQFPVQQMPAQQMPSSGILSASQGHQQGVSGPAFSSPATTSPATFSSQAASDHLYNNNNSSSSRVPVAYSDLEELLGLDQL